MVHLNDLRDSYLLSGNLADQQQGSTCTKRKNVAYIEKYHRGNPGILFASGSSCWVILGKI